MDESPANSRDVYAGTAVSLAKAFEDLATKCKNGKKLIIYPVVEGPLKKSELHKKQLIRCGPFIRRGKKLHDALAFKNKLAKQTFNLIFRKHAKRWKMKHEKEEKFSTKMADRMRTVFFQYNKARHRTRPAPWVKQILLAKDDDEAAAADDAGNDEKGRRR